MSAVRKITMSLLSIILCIWPSLSFASDELRDEAHAFSRIELNGAHLSKGSSATYILAHIARYRGRKLTLDEVNDLVGPLCEITSDQLTSTKKDGDRPWCFLGESRILTPSGYRFIRDLIIGDKVLSIDVHSGQLIENSIEKLSRTQNQVVGILKGLGLQGADIGVTPRHPFFLPTRDDYLAIGAIDPQSLLLRALPINETQAELSLVRRGEFVLSKTPRTVFNMHLENEPNNFCVESLVAHNMIAKAF